VKDIFGELFEVTEFRGTTHGFDLLFGWPERRKKGFGRGRCEVILSMPLAEHLDQAPGRPARRETKSQNAGPVTYIDS
jgi:hypothetical protein